MCRDLIRENPQDVTNFIGVKGGISNLCLLQRAPACPRPPAARAASPADGHTGPEQAKKTANKIMCVAAPQENEMAVPQGKTGCAFAFAKLVTKEDP